MSNAVADPAATAPSTSAASQGPRRDRRRRVGAGGGARLVVVIGGPVRSRRVTASPSSSRVGDEIAAARR
jgi:hypothetical protein